MAVVERELTAAPSAETPHLYRWTREQFCQMGDAGFFEGQRVILVEGEILQMPAIGPVHQSLTTDIGDTLRAAFSDGYIIREQGPFDIGTDTDPEPDIAVVVGKRRDFTKKHPAEAALIVEVSVSTLAYDRVEKAGLYAGAGVQDYWIINPGDACVEVYRNPQVQPDKPFGHGYAEMRTYRGGDAVTPLAKPDSAIEAQDLL